MKLKDLHESSTPFKTYGAWTIFTDDSEIQGFTNFGVPLSGSALMAHCDSAPLTLLLGVDPDGEVAPRDTITVTVVQDEEGITFKKSWPDTKEGYKEAKKFAEKMRKGQDPTA